MRRPSRQQRAGVLSSVIGLHALLFVVLMMGATVQYDRVDPHAKLSIFDLVTPPPPPEVADPQPLEPIAEDPAPLGPPEASNDALPSLADSEMILADAPIAPASIAIEPIVRLPMPNAAAERPISGTGVGKHGGGGDQGGGTGKGGGGTGGKGLVDEVLQLKPYWIRQPTRAEWREVWPRTDASGQEQFRPGVASLDCAVLSDNRTNDCRVRAERPAGRGMGRAAIKLSRHFRIRRAERNGDFIPSRVQFDVTFDVDQQ